MDQKPLVESQIDDGFKLVKRLVTGGFQVTAAFWVRASEDGQWTLYLASKTFDDKGPAVAYRMVADVLVQLEDSWVSMSEIQVIGERHPITQDVLDIMRRHPGPMATRLRRPRLGDLEIEEVYLYPLLEGAARRQTPTIRITGIKKGAHGSVTEEAEEVGYVEGFVGEPEFNTKFAALITSKFGSPEQFGVTYPRIILEEV